MDEKKRQVLQSIFFIKQHGFVLAIAMIHSYIATSACRRLWPMSIRNWHTYKLRKADAMLTEEAIHRSRVRGWKVCTNKHEWDWWDTLVTKKKVTRHYYIAILQDIRSCVTFCPLSTRYYVQCVGETSRNLNTRKWDCTTRKVRLIGHLYVLAHALMYGSMQNLDAFLHTATTTTSHAERSRNGAVRDT